MKRRSLHSLFAPVTALFVASAFIACDKAPEKTNAPQPEPAKPATEKAAEAPKPAPANPAPAQPTAEVAKPAAQTADIAKVARAHPNLSGRDVKNLLKLATFASGKGSKVDAAAVEYALQFKPTENYA